MKKLIEVQAELKAPKNQFNAFGKYKYRNQEDILEALKPLLLKHELLLTLTDEIKEICGQMFTEATVKISDGKDSLEVKAQAGIDVNKKGMDKAQCFGSSSSYARKYALNAMFLIDDTKQIDEDNKHEDKPPVKPLLNTVRFEKAMEAVKKGDYTSDQLEIKYDLTDTQKEQLTNLL